MKSKKVEKSKEVWKVQQLLPWSLVSNQCRGIYEEEQVYILFATHLDVDMT